MNKCRTEQNLFHEFISSKIRTKGSHIETKGGEIYIKKIRTICEAMNNSLQPIFIKDHSMVFNSMDVKMLKELIVSMI